MTRIEILPNLWISSVKSANNKQLNELANISIFINADSELYFIENKCHLNEAMIYNLTQYDILNLNNSLSKIIKYLNKQLNNNIGVLIFSNTVPDITILIIYSYLVKYGELDKKNAINIIKSKYYNIDYSIKIFDELFDKIIL